MSKKRNKKLFLFISITLAFLVLLGIGAFFIYQKTTHAPKAMSVNSPQDTTKQTTEATQQPTEAYRGRDVTISEKFTVKVPNGWSAYTSTRANFTAIMFAKPNQLASLVYSADTPPTIGEGIASWSGLTEHFFILAPTSTQQFDPADHQEVSSESFNFDDSTTGEKYYVVKHAEEAKKWGGLQKDTEWQGRTYVYENGGPRIEAHLAVYPSTQIDLQFYEQVVRSIRYSTP